MCTNLKIAVIFAAAWMLTIAMSGCSIAPPNSPVCVETNIDSARCTTLMTGETFVVDETHLLEGKTYWQIRPQMILVPASSWVEIKKFVLDICHQTHQCDSTVATWDQTINQLSTELDSKAVGAP